jgi:hypothetical protein
VRTRREGPETGANPPVAESDSFPLDQGSDFWETRCCRDIEFPGFVPDSTARHWRAFLFSGVGVPLRTMTTRANQIRERRECE